MRALLRQKDRLPVDAFEKLWRYAAERDFRPEVEEDGILRRMIGL